LLNVWPPLDQWAEILRGQIDRNFHHYQENPAYFYNSTNFYKMVMMASILSSQFNIHYNPQLIESPTEKRTDDHFFADSHDCQRAVKTSQGWADENQPL
jgi:hypothetical protein